MKKYSKITAAILFVVFSFLTIETRAQDFSGIIVYNITSESNSMDPQMIAMMPKTMKLTIKGNMSKTEMSMGMGKTIIIFNAKDKSGITLLDVMGQKFALKMSSQDVEAAIKEIPKTSVTVIDEIKEIAGYSCKKAIVATKDKSGNTDSEQMVYYTEELGSGMLNYNNPFFKDINGVMLEYSTNEDDISMKFTAISVEKKKISEKEFEIPEGFKEVSQEDLESMFGS